MDALMLRVMALPNVLEDKIMGYAHYIEWKPINYEFKYLLYCIHRSKLLKNNRFKISDIDIIKDYPNWTYIFNKSLYSHVGPCRKRVVKRTQYTYIHSHKQYAKVIRDAFPCIFIKVIKNKTNK